MCGALMVMLVVFDVSWLLHCGGEREGEIRKMAMIKMVRVWVSRQRREKVKWGGLGKSHVRCT